MPKEGPPYTDDKQQQNRPFEEILAEINEPLPEEVVSEPAPADDAPAPESKVPALKHEGLTPRKRSTKKKVPKAPVAEAEPLPESLPVLSETTDIDTRKEGEDALRAVVSRFDDAPKVSSAQTERADLQVKETAYLTAFKELESKKSVWNRLLKGKDLSSESSKVEELKRAYDESRVAYANALTKSVEQSASSRSLQFEARTQERYERLKEADSLPRSKDGTQIDFATYMERAYDARVAKVEGKLASYIRFREVVRPLAEKKLAARREALDARGRNVFEKALGWSATQNQKLESRFGKNGARAIRALASTVLVAGGAAAAGSFGTASLVALAGWGTYKFARSFGGSLLGAAGGELGAFAYEKLRGRAVQESAKKSLLSAGRNAGELSLESLERLDAKRDKLAVTADEITLQKKKALVKALVAFGIGAGAASVLAEFTAVQQGAEVAASGAAPMPAPDLAPAPSERIPPVPSPEPALAAEVPEPELSPAPTEPAVYERVTALPDAAPQPVSVAAEPLPAALDESAITAELNRAAVNGQDIAPSSESIATPYESVQALPVETQVETVVVPEPEAPESITSSETVQELPPESVVGPVESEPLPVESVPEPVEAPAPAEIETQVVPEAVPEVAHAEVPASVAPEPILETVVPESTAPAIEQPAVSPEVASSEGNINAHGVNIDSPGVVMVDGKYFVHGGADSEANYKMAVAYAREIAPTNPGTPIYFIEERMTVLGGLERNVRAVSYDPAYDNMPMPYVSRNGVVLEVPPIPDPADYEPVPTRR